MGEAYIFFRYYLQTLESEEMLVASRHPHPQCPSKTETYLKVTAFTVAPSGRFRYLPTSFDMDGRRMLTCITDDLATFYGMQTCTLRIKPCFCVQMEDDRGSESATGL